MSTQPASKFDGLANDYDQARPRYPQSILNQALKDLPTEHPLNVVDAGTGTGIALEALLPLLPEHSNIQCVDTSADMVRLGK